MKQNTKTIPTIYKTMKVFEREDMDSYTSECWSNSNKYYDTVVDFWIVSEYNDKVMTDENDVSKWLIDHGAEVGEEVLILNYR